MTELDRKIILAGRKIESLERQLRSTNPDSPVGRNLSQRIEGMKSLRTLYRNMSHPQTREGRECLIA